MISLDHPDPVIVEILDPECPPGVGVEIVGVVVANSVIPEHTPSSNMVAINKKERYVRLYIQIQIKK
jgi:hypothetical protein